MLNVHHLVGSHINGLVSSVTALNRALIRVCAYTQHERCDDILIFTRNTNKT